ERGLTTKLHDHAIGTLDFDDIHDILKSERLEVEAVGGGIIVPHRLRITVYHNGLVAVLFQGKGGVHAAVIKLNALANAVGATTEDHDFFHGLRRGFAGALVGRIQVRGMCHKFSATSVDPLKRRLDVLLLAQSAK